MSSGPLSHRNEARLPVDGDEPVELVDELIGGAAPADAHRERLAGVLVDDVGELQPAVVGGLVELEVDRPHVIRAQSREPLRTVGSDPAPFAGPLRRPFESFVAPQPLDALAVHRPAFPPHDRERPSCNPTADVPGRSHAAGRQLGVVERARPSRLAVASTGAGPRLGMLVVRRPRNAPARDTPPAGVAPGSEVSLRQLLEHVDVERLLRDELLQPRVLTLQLA